MDRSLKEDGLQPAEKGIVAEYGLIARYSLIQFLLTLTLGTDNIFASRHDGYVILARSCPLDCALQGLNQLRESIDKAV